MVAGARLFQSCVTRHSRVSWVCLPLPREVGGGGVDVMDGARSGLSLKVVVNLGSMGERRGEGRAHSHLGGNTMQG